MQREVASGKKGNFSKQYNFFPRDNVSFTGNTKNYLSCVSKSP